MEKTINNIFFRFSHKCDDNFDLEKFEEWLEEVKSFKYNKKDEKNELSIWISNIGCIWDIENPPVIWNEWKNIFHWRFVKWKYWEQIFFYKNDWNYSTINEEDDHIWRPSNKNEDEIIVNEFYYIFKLYYNESENIINWVISKPTFKEFITKNDLELLVKEILKSNFWEWDDEYNIQNFELNEIYSSNEISRLSWLWATISYVEQKTVWDVVEELWEQIDWIDENQVVNLKITINQTNTAFLFPLFKKRILNTHSTDIPLKDIKIKTPQWTFLDLDWFYFSKKIKVNITDWTIILDQKSYFISELSRFIQDKIYPVIL